MTLDASQSANGAGPACLNAVSYAVTFEVGELVTELGQRRFQARVRMADIVTSDIGEPQMSELDALDQIATAFTKSKRTR